MSRADRTCKGYTPSARGRGAFGRARGGGRGGRPGAAWRPSERAAAGGGRGVDGGGGSSYSYSLYHTQLV